MKNTKLPKKGEIIYCFAILDNLFGTSKPEVIKIKLELSKPGEGGYEYKKTCVSKKHVLGCSARTNKDGYSYSTCAGFYALDNFFTSAKAAHERIKNDKLHYQEEIKEDFKTSLKKLKRVLGTKKAAQFIVSLM